MGLSAVLYWRSTEPGKLTAVATIASPAGAQLWEVDVYRDSGRLIMHTGRFQPMPRIVTSSCGRCRPAASLFHWV